MRNAEKAERWLTQALKRHKDRCEPEPLRFSVGLLAAVGRPARYGGLRFVAPFAWFEIHDTGRGMSSAALKRLFEPFYTTKPPGLGTGLGLTICRDIVASLGGQIEVESSEGQGSVFRVVLPAIVVPG